MNGKGSTRQTQMKRSPSELAFEEFVQENILNYNYDNISSGRTLNNESPISKVDSFCDTWTPDGFLNGDYAGDLDFAFNSPDYGTIPETNIPWPHNLTSKSSGISGTIESQSSIICADSPVSVTPPSGRDEIAVGGGNGSSGEQTDDEDAETEAGPSVQSNKSLDIKRIRRMDSNRESARRSRQKRQALLAELELQVDRLRLENSTLFKQLTDAAQQHHDADTNHRVLKSDVEALRAKVKLAEDMVARGSLTCSLNQLLQNHLNSPQTFSTNNIGQIANVSPGIAVNGMSVSQQNSSLGIGNTELSTNGIMSDAVSGVTDIWH